MNKRYIAAACGIMLALGAAVTGYAEQKNVVELRGEHGEIVEIDLDSYEGVVLLDDPAYFMAVDEADATPEPTDEPEATPESADEPEVTPEPTDEPEATPEPTDEPEATPESADEPEVTPESTDEPEATPEPTDEPDSTPESADEPEVTPERTDEPEATPTPDATAAPTGSPAVTPLPTIAPEVFAAYDIQIIPPSGWSNDDAETARISVKDAGGTGFEKVEMRLAGGDWTDITGDVAGGAEASVDVTRNGLLVVRVSDPWGEYHRDQAEVTCFDRHPPTVKAGVKDEMLHVVAADTQSGVAGVQVNGLLFTTLENGELDVKIMELLKAYKTLCVRAYDFVGNFSDIVEIDNPYYTEPASDDEGEDDAPKATRKPSGGGSKATPKPTETPNVTPVPTAAATAMPTSMPTHMPVGGVATAEPKVEYIPLGPGQPYTPEGNMQTLDMLYSAATNKQFITIQARTGETYYLIIDYDKPIDEDAEIYETYFLNAVDNRDLLAVLADEEKPTPTPVPTPTPTLVPTAAPVKEDDGEKPGAAALLMLMTLGLLGGGAAMWFVMRRKDERKQPSMEGFEFDEEDSDDDE